MTLVTPHLAFPLLPVNGRFALVEQGSPRHVSDQAEIVLRTTPGDFVAMPQLGLRPLVARTAAAAPVVIQALEQAIPGQRFLAEEDLSQLAQRVRSVTVSILQEDAE